MYGKTENNLCSRQYDLVIYFLRDNRKQLRSFLLYELFGILNFFEVVCISFYFNEITYFYTC